MVKVIKDTVVFPPEHYHLGQVGEVIEVLPWMGEDGDPLVNVQFENESFPYWKEELEPAEGSTNAAEQQTA